MREAGKSSISEREVRDFFDAFCAAFGTFSGEAVAARYAAPYLAVGADGEIRHLATLDEIAEYFQRHLDRYRQQGCSACAYENLQLVALGNQAALASLTWRLTGPSGALVSSWRESYNLVRRPEGLRVYASTDHVD